MKYTRNWKPLVNNTYACVHTYDPERFIGIMALSPDKQMRTIHRQEMTMIDQNERNFRKLQSLLAKNQRAHMLVIQENEKHVLAFFRSLIRDGEATKVDGLVKMQEHLERSIATLRDSVGNLTEELQESIEELKLEIERQQDERHQ